MTTKNLSELLFLRFGKEVDAVQVDVSKDINVRETVLLNSPIPLDQINDSDLDYVCETIADMISEARRADHAILSFWFGV